MEAKQTEALNRAGAFFAFSTKQFDEQKKTDTIYTNMYAGMICPKDTAQELDRALTAIYHDSIAEDIADNGLNGIIRRELNNHEAYYTRDLKSTIDALKDYPNITAEDIKEVFNNKHALI
jgi:hypothetical protein